MDTKVDGFGAKQNRCMRENMRVRKLVVASQLFYCTQAYMFYECYAQLCLLQITGHTPRSIQDRSELLLLRFLCFAFGLQGPPSSGIMFEGNGSERRRFARVEERNNNGRSIGAQHLSAVYGNTTMQSKSRSAKFVDCQGEPFS